MPDYAFQGFQLDAGITPGQGMYLGDQHNFGYFDGDGLPYSYAMTLEDLMLQGAGIFFRDPGIGQDAEAGVHAVYRCIPAYYIGDLFLTASYLFNHFWIQNSRKIPLGPSNSRS